ncbi:aldehyd dehydrogenase, mitochondrial 3 precursor related protein [Thermoplasma acidophilum]|uniref:Aldehyd dehydrogenase, mitochondrial 3 related protein n=1 Tax=Thermoplasma acidophilum (strain ATCC 25905 / DSM 1728 / JCM 9062 / NBRC 15155 / AMRC-C165) TaxID=273075 RepID=Q9HLK7_THEAC|nr:aldehyde dehydrogenase [Thermoplasma acidophilum]MCY0851433.1 aldehyde dehydrogenase family protein [Thermoplasma acidophilum]CAC11366.1 aldehyd dehydrogenase, mitochondrial 3 precursor related protein [Thermoplasma acidophilum]
MIIKNRFTDEIEDAYLDYGSPPPEWQTVQNAAESLRSMPTDQLQSSAKSVFDYIRQNMDAILPRISRTTGKPMRYLRLEVDRSLSETGKIVVMDEPMFHDIPQYSVVYPNYQDPVSSLIVPSIFFLLNRVPVIVVPDRYAFLVPSLIYKAFASSGLPSGSFSISNGGIPEGFPSTRYAVSYSTDAMPEAAPGSGTLHADRGGPSMAVVWKDADVDFAAQNLVDSVIERHSIFLRSIVVHDEIFEYFVNRLKDLLPSIVAGDPEDLSTQLGPCASDIDLIRSLNMIAEARRARSIIYSKGPQGNIITPTIINGEITDMDDMVYTPVYILHHASSMEEVFELVSKVGPEALALYSSDSMLFRMVLSRTSAKYIGLNSYPEISYKPPISIPRRGLYL